MHPAAVLILPAKIPFIKVLCTADIPSISAVKLLSSPQLIQAELTRIAETIPGRPSFTESITPDITARSTPDHPLIPRKSLKNRYPRTAVAAISRLSHSETDEADASFSPDKIRIGPRIPPKAIEPESLILLLRFNLNRSGKSPLYKISGNKPIDAPRYRRPASKKGLIPFNNILLTGVAIPNKTADKRASIIAEYLFLINVILFSVNQILYCPAILFPVYHF